MYVYFDNERGRCRGGEGIRGDEVRGDKGKRSPTRTNRGRGEPIKGDTGEIT